MELAGGVSNPDGGGVVADAVGTEGSDEVEAVVDASVTGHGDEGGSDVSSGRVDSCKESVGRSLLVIEDVATSDGKDPVEAVSAFSR